LRGNRGRMTTLEASDFRSYGALLCLRFPSGMKESEKASARKSPQSGSIRGLLKEISAVSV
jgi:hypothetical protein